jgi:hypothetical protein
MILKYLKSKRKLFTEQELLLGIEFGTVLSEVAKVRKIELTPEIAVRAEEIFVKEIREQGAKGVACQFVPLVLVCFELKE